MAAKLDELTGLVNAITSVKGSKTKTKSNRTTQTAIEQEGVDRLVADMLAGPGGVGEIGAASKQSGLYNSTTEDLLRDDLYSRVASRVSLARSPTVESTSGTTEAPGIGFGGLAGTLLASQAAGSLLKGEIPFKNVISGIFNKGGASNILKVGKVPAANVVNGTRVAGSGGVASGAASEVATNTLGGTLSANAVPLAGGFLSGILQGKKAVKDPTNLALTAGSGFLYGGPAGAAAALLATGAGAYGKDIFKGAENIASGVLKGAGKIGKKAIKGIKKLF